MANNNQYVFYLNADVKQFNAAMKSANQSFSNVEKTVNKGLKITVDKSGAEGLKTVVNNLTQSMLEEARAVKNATDFTDKFNQATKMQSDFLSQYNSKVTRTSNSLSNLGDAVEHVGKKVETDFLNSLRKVSRDGDLSKVTEQWEASLSKAEQELEAASRIVVQYKDETGQLIEVTAQLNREEQEYVPIMTRTISNKEQAIQATKKQSEALEKEKNHISEVIRKYTELGSATLKSGSAFERDTFKSQLSDIETNRQKALAAQTLLQGGNLSAEQFEAIKVLIQGLDDNYIKLKQDIAETGRVAEEAGNKLPMSIEKADQMVPGLDNKFVSLNASIQKTADSNRYASGTFESLLSETDSLKNAASDLQAQHDKNLISDREYINSLSQLSIKAEELDQRFIELKSSTEKLPMTMEQADSAVLSLQNGLNRMSTDVDKVKDKFVAGTFNNITTDIESLRTNLETLQIAFQNGTISEETYTRSLEMMQLQLKTLQTDLIQTKANNEKLAFTQEQAETAATKLAQSMDNLQIRINKVKNGYVGGTFDQVTIAINKNRQALIKLLDEYAKTGDLKKFGNELKKLQNQFNNTTVSMEKKAESGGTHTVTGDNFLQNMGKYARWYFGGNLITGAKRQFQEAFKEMKAVDAELIQVKKVTDLSSESLKKMGDRAYEVGKKYGVAASEYLDAVAAYSRAGMKDAAEDLAELSVKASLVGDMAQDDATAMFLALQKAYGLTTKELNEVLDGLNELDNKHATTIENITEGMGKVASIAEIAHVGVDELSSAIGTITAVTQRSGTEAATALRALFLNIIGDTKTEIEEGETATVESIKSARDALKEYFPELVDEARKTRTIINPMRVIEAISQLYSAGRISEENLAQLMTDLGGKLRSGQLAALVKNWGEYNSQIEHFNDSFNSADKEVENALGSWEKQLQILSNTWTQFIADSVSTDFIKKTITKVTELINGIGNLKNALIIVTGIIISIKAQKIVSGLNTVIEEIGALATKTLTAASAASLFQIAIFALTAAFAAFIIHQNKMIQMYHEQAEESAKVARESREESDSILELYKQYKKAKSGSEELEKASSNLADALGIEKDKVLDLADAYDKAITKKLNTARRDALTAEDSASKLLSAEATSFGHVISGTFGGTSDNYVNSKFWGKMSAGSDLPEKRLNSIFEKAFREGKISKTPYGYSFLSNSAEDIATFVNLCQEGVNAIQDLVIYGEGIFDESLLNTQAYNDMLQTVATYGDLVDSYKTAHQNRVELEAQAHVYKLVEQGALNSVEAIGKLIKETRDSTEYSEEYKEAIIEIARGLLNDLNPALEETAETTEEIAEGAAEATSAVKKFQDALKEKNTDALDAYVDLFKEFKEAADSGKYGSKQFQYGLQALFTDEKIASAKGDWAALAKEAEKLQRALTTADNSGIEFFDYLKKQGKSIGDHVWEIADGVLTIKQNSNGSWSWDIFGETAEELAASISRISEETGLNVELLGAMFQAWGDFDVGGFDLYKQATDLLLGDKKDEYILSGKNIDTDGIHSVLAPAVRDSISTGVGEALGTAEDVEGAISKSVTSGVTDGVEKANLEESFKTDLSNAAEAALGEGASVWAAFEKGAKSALDKAFSDPKFDFDNQGVKDAVISGIASEAKKNNIGGALIEKYLPDKLGIWSKPKTEEMAAAAMLAQIEQQKINNAAIISQKLSEFSFEGDVGERTEEYALEELKDKTEHFLGLAAETLAAAVDEYVLENDVDIDDSMDTGAEAAERVLEVWEDIKENWEEVEQQPEKYAGALENVANISQGILDGTLEIPEEWKEVNDELGTAHAILQFIEQLLFGIKDASGDVELEVDASSQKDDVQDFSDAIEEVPDSKTVEFPNNAPDATTETNSLTAAIDAVPTSKTIKFTIITEGGIPALPEASGTDYFPGGTAFVNDEPGGYNPELIVEKDKAYIVNGGNPALVHISRGAKIFNADETRRILDGGDKLAAFPRFRVGTTTLKKEENKSGGGKKSSDSHTHDSDD